jgi:hypothetical protein
MLKCARMPRALAEPDDVSVGRVLCICIWGIGFEAERCLSWSTSQSRVARWRPIIIVLLLSQPCARTSSRLRTCSSTRPSTWRRAPACCARGVPLSMDNFFFTDLISHQRSDTL